MPVFQAQLEEWIQAACQLEVSARKPGNVHPEASFDDLTYADFVASANVIAPVLATPQSEGLGKTVFKAVEATRKQVRGNSNLGMILLLAPLAAVPREQTLDQGVAKVLAGLTRDDADWVYRAIRLAEPGGMGKVRDGDVADRPAGTLLEMMQLACDRDRVAAEYATGFSLTLNVGIPFLAGFPDFQNRWETAIIELQLRLMADYPDTLITRKCGKEVAEESARRARNVLDSGPFESEIFQSHLKDFDHWLRSDGHKRNPGTTADLIAASLFSGLREGKILALGHIC